MRADRLVRPAFAAVAVSGWWFGRTYDPHQPVGWLVLCPTGVHVMEVWQRHCAGCHEAAAGPAAVPRWPDRLWIDVSHPVEGTRITLGGPSCDVPLPGARGGIVATLVQADGRWTLEPGVADLTVNGVVVRGPVEVRPSDRIARGVSVARLRSAPAPQGRRT